MIFEVNFKYVSTLGTLSRKTIAIDAKDIKEAAAQADKKMKEAGLPYRQIGEPRPF